MHQGHDHHSHTHGEARIRDRQARRAERRAPAAGHNRDIAGELHSHPHSAVDPDGLRALAATFVAGFREAEDKISWLRLAGVPLAIPGKDGLERKLVDVTIADGFQVATASPGFGSRELVYLPFPGSMVQARTTLTFVYVSLTGRSDIDLIDFLAGRFAHADPAST